MFSEFKKFLFQGNILDLAVGVVMGGAFGKLPASLVEDIINPIIGLAMNGVDFKAKAITLKDAVVDAAGKETAPALALKWGNFVNVGIQFVIVAFVIYLIVKAARKADLTEK
jgi:large conductance mechanosensitive channel